MQVTRFREPQSFLECAESFLTTAEAENNLMLGIRGMASAFGEDAYLAAVMDGGRVVACAMRTPPSAALMTRATTPGIECLVADLAERYPELPGILGPEPGVAEFAALWTRLTGKTSSLGTRQRIFEIRESPTLATWPSGRLRLADEHDLPLVKVWTAAFIAEALPGDPRDPDTHAASRVASRGVFLWEDERPVSMAGWAGRTARGVRVSFVYTPPEFRRLGYAAACVASLTQQLLDEGQSFCCLYADLANPTSNGIYQRMGYRPICDVSSYTLHSGNTSSIR